MSGPGSKRGKREGGRNDFSHRVLLLLMLIIILTIFFWWERLKLTPTATIQSNAGLEKVRLQTLRFIEQYKKQLKSDFGDPYGKMEIGSSGEKPSRPGRVHQATYDPNSVIHTDSGPIPQKKVNSFTSYSELFPHGDNIQSETIPFTKPKSSIISNNLIIGMAQDTDPKNLVTFCASLRKHSSADVVLFMNQPISSRNDEIVKKYNIKVIPFSLVDFPEELQGYHPSTLRWIMMDRYLEAEENINKYRYVWMIDVRDSMFQDDPFKMIADETSAFYAFKGVEDKTISQCGWNGGWIKDCFGQAKLNQVGHNNIICSGVSVGSMDVVLKYLKMMRSIVEGRSSDAKFPACERNGVDQGIHNVLVHTKKIDKLRIFDQASSPVLNLQARIAQVDEKRGIVRNKAGQVAAVVHQYDRFPALQKKLFEQYAYWIDFSDPMFEWNSDSECHRFEYVKDVDMFRGICDFKIKGGMTGPNSCCSICSKYPDCTSFTFYQGQCFLKKGCTGKTKNGKASRLPGAVSAYYK